MFIQRDPAAIGQFACTFVETLCTSAGTANRILLALISTIEK